jgi:hypothetical protein
MSVSALSPGQQLISNSYIGPDNQITPKGWEFIRKNYEERGTWWTEKDGSMVEVSPEILHSAYALNETPDDGMSFYQLMEKYAASNPTLGSNEDDELERSEASSNHIFWMFIVVFLIIIFFYMGINYMNGGAAE